MQKSASQILRDAAKIYENDNDIPNEHKAIAVAAGMSEKDFDQRFDKARENFNYYGSTALSVLADFFEEQEEVEEIFEPSYGELYTAAIEHLASLYDDAIVARVKWQTKDVSDLVQYKEFQNEKAFVVSIFNKNVREVMDDVRNASKLLEFYF